MKLKEVFITDFNTILNFKFDLNPVEKFILKEDYILIKIKKTDLSLEYSGDPDELSLEVIDYCQKIAKDYWNYKPFQLTLEKQ